MEEILTNMNVELNEVGGKREKVCLLAIPNPDGSPRWMVPADSRNDLFLRFYTTGSFKGKFTAFLLTWIFRLGLQKVFFKTQEFDLASGRKKSKCPVDVRQSNWALFTGTQGPNRKYVLCRQVEEKVDFFKVPISEASQRLLTHEFESYKRLAGMNSKAFAVPKACLQTDGVLALQGLGNGPNHGPDWSSLHENALSELFFKTAQRRPLSNLPIWKESRELLDRLNETRSPRIPKGMLRKLTLLQDSLEQSEVMTCMAHGDFTPWNTLETNGKLAILDWELAIPNAPVGYDAFHFVIQNGILAKRQSWIEIRASLEEKVKPFLQRELEHGPAHFFNEQLGMYLFIHTVRNLDLYSRQGEWHAQIAWQLSIWNQALSDVIAPQLGHRQLAIMDLFDFLQGKRYVTIGFPDHAPELLGTHSDIDLCLDKHLVKETISFMKGHLFCSHLQTERLSFKGKIRMVLKDNSMLSLDLIWSLKRKSLVMMDAEEVVKTGKANRFGIRQMACRDHVVFLGLFYALNNAKIPGKLQAYEAVLKDASNPLENVLRSNLQDGQIRKDSLRKNLLATSANQGFRRWMNKLNYGADLLREWVGPKGWVMTFSGVDGAGKSTVLEKTRYEIEKQLRRRTVVLRHRPSVLPILSRWTRGKSKAQATAAEQLPHQGTNESRVGSLLRFSYYYLDYLIGQFYVHFRYVKRGYVVLYDRYYFDFIHDPKRSNIVLPKGLANMGYKLLMKPKLNFFLHADTEAIRKRKQELDTATIGRLNGSYLRWFGKRSAEAPNRYFIVHNKDLEQTMHTILNETFPKSA